MTFHNITIADSGEVYRCKPEETVLNGMERLGRKGIPVGCRGGGCGVCKVHILAGEYTKRVMSRAYISPDEEFRDIVLACRVKPGSDLTLSVMGKMKEKVCTQAGGGDFAA